MILCRLLPILALLLLGSGEARAQATPGFQSGGAVPNAVAKITANGLYTSGGDLTGDALGRGVNPFAISDGNGLGLLFVNTTNISNAHVAFGLGHDADGNGLIKLYSAGGAAEKKIKCDINGVVSECGLRADGTTITVTNNVLSVVSGGGGINQLTGDVTAGPGTGSQAATLANSGVSAGTYTKITVDAKGRATVGATASCADLSDDGAGCTAGAASTSAAGIAKLHNVPVAVGWPAALNPNNVILANIDQASTITKIVGVNEVLVGAAATVSVYKAASGVSCGAGTVLHSGSFDANASLDTNQTLTLTATTLAAGDRICLQTTGGANWTSGVGVGTITVFLAPTP